MSRSLVLAFALLALGCDSSSGPAPSLASSSASHADMSPPSPGASSSSADTTGSLAPPTPPLARAYDRDADLHARLELARAQLGPLVPSHVEGDVFLLLGSRPGAFFDRSVALAHEALDAYAHDRFTQRPTRAVSVYIFPDRAPYDAYCEARFGAPCRSRFGLYRKDTREIFVNAGPGVTTLTHELVHPFVEEDFPAAPAWLNEGLGALYEAPVFGAPGEIHGARTNWRINRLRAARARPGERDRARLAALFTMSDAEFLDDEALGYAVARQACVWLDTEKPGLLWPFYRAWRDTAPDDPHGEKAFARVVGETPEEAEGDWGKWVDGR